MHFVEKNTCLPIYVASLYLCFPSFSTANAAKCLYGPQMVHQFYTEVAAKEFSVKLSRPDKRKGIAQPLTASRLRFSTLNAIFLQLLSKIVKYCTQYVCRKYFLNVFL